MSHHRLGGAVAIVLLQAAGPLAAQAVGTAFTHQGRLADGGSPANGPYDFRCILYDAPAGGSQVGSIVPLEDVAVADGLFTIALDFGAGAFRGSARWLEIAVRPGPSTGAYTVVGTRQELRPAPNAIFSSAAAEVQWTGVSGKPPGFADNVDNDSGGTVTSVATGAGLTGGPITGSGTVAVATGGITTALLANGAVTAPKIANGAVGASQIDQSQVQTRIGGTCPLGSYLRGINPDGTVVCAGLMNPHAITTVHIEGATVSQPSIAIPADGRPVITYYHQFGALHLIKCGNSACTGGNVDPLLDSAGGNDVGTYASVAIGSDGFPVVSYHDATLGTLKVVHCFDAACSTTFATTVDDHPVNAVGEYTSIAIGTDGLPVISYHDATAGGLKVAKCQNTNCSGLNTITMVHNPANDVGERSAIAIGTDGLPVIAYHDVTARTLYVAKCTNASCGAATISQVAQDVFERRIDVAVPADGRPVMSYIEVDGQLYHMHVIKCGNAACSAGNVDTLVGDFQTDTSIAIGADGLPIVSVASGGLVIVKCGDAACSAGNLTSHLDHPPQTAVGFHSSIAVGADTLPVVAYEDYTNGSLKVAKCGSATCN